jgi:hypothetical protein
METWRTSEPHSRQAAPAKIASVKIVKRKREKRALITKLEKIHEAYRIMDANSRFETAKEFPTFLKRSK